MLVLTSDLENVYKHHKSGVWKLKTLGPISKKFCCFPPTKDTTKVSKIFNKYVGFAAKLCIFCLWTGFEANLVFIVDKLTKIAYNNAKNIERQCGRNPLSIRLFVLTTD